MLLNDDLINDERIDLGFIVCIYNLRGQRIERYSVCLFLGSFLMTSETEWSTSFLMRALGMLPLGWTVIQYFFNFFRNKSG